MRLSWRRPSADALVAVAGEPSGDALAAEVVRALGVPTLALGGPALESAGAELVANTASAAEMGARGVLRAPMIALAVLRLLRRARGARAALLAGWSEVNAHVGRALRRRGVRVLWYGAPQIWAWRGARGPRLRESCDRMAVLLPFEEALWRGLGSDAHYVGHPALGSASGLASESGLVLGAERPKGSRGTERMRLLLLPGSRTSEVAGHLGPMLAAARLLDADAAVLLAPTLPARALAAARSLAAESGARIASTGELALFDLAVACSGTVTLECVARGVPPVIVYRTDPITAAAARRLVRTPHIGLPNIVLGKRAFPELVQGEVTALRIAAELRALYARPNDFARACAEVRARLATPVAPAARVAALLAPWLA